MTPSIDLDVNKRLLIVENMEKCILKVITEEDGKEHLSLEVTAGGESSIIKIKFLEEGKLDIEID